jgi:hypothetical protein
VNANAAQSMNARLNHRILGSALGLMMLFAVVAPAFAQDAAQSSTSNGPVAHGTIALAAPVTYDNRWEVYGGLSYMNSTAGPLFIQRMNMGGGEVMGTRWFTGAHGIIGPERVGVAGDIRGEYGTTPVRVNDFHLNRVLVFQNMAMVGGVIRGPKNQFFALNGHLLGGASRGDFSHGTEPAAAPQNVGLYTNRWAPIGAIGTSLDINISKQLAFRFSPDLMLSHWGDATDTNFFISLGFVYRFNK